MDRKSMKTKAKSTLRKHYWMIVVICLFSSVFGVEYASSTWSLDFSTPTDTVQTSRRTAQSSGVTGILGDLVVGDESTAREQAKRNEEQIVKNDTNAVFGRKRGVLATPYRIVYTTAFLRILQFRRRYRQHAPHLFLTGIAN